MLEYKDYREEAKKLLVRNVEGKDHKGKTHIYTTMDVPVDDRMLHWRPATKISQTPWEYTRNNGNVVEVYNEYRTVGYDEEEKPAPGWDIVGGLVLTLIGANGDNILKFRAYGHDVGGFLTKFYETMHTVWDAQKAFALEEDKKENRRRMLEEKLEKEKLKMNSDDFINEVLGHAQRTIIEREDDGLIGRF